MSHEQERMRNPFGMDDACPNCPALVESRCSIVHGYGDVGAEFLFVLESPDSGADAAGHPLAGDENFVALLDEIGFLTGDLSPCGRPRLANAFITHLTRCRHPDRPATDREIGNCDPFLTAEIRSINPEIIVPVGQRPLEQLAREYTTQSVNGLSVADEHAETIRGRGFELLPMVEPATLTQAHIDSFLAAMAETMGRDYRQTKGRQSR